MSVVSAEVPGELLHFLWHVFLHVLRDPALVAVIGLPIVIGAGVVLVGAILTSDD